MTDHERLNANPDEPAIYEIRVLGHLGPQWTDWFEGMTFRQEATGEMVIIGLVPDQAALHGLIKKVRDLGLPLVSVQRLDPDPQG